MVSSLYYYDYKFKKLLKYQLINQNELPKYRTSNVRAKNRLNFLSIYIIYSV